MAKRKGSAPDPRGRPNPRGGGPNPRGGGPDSRGPWPGGPDRPWQGPRWQDGRSPDGRSPDGRGQDGSWPESGDVQTWRAPPRLLRRLRRWRGPGGCGPLRRGREDRLVGGVAAGLAARTGWDVTVVRSVFVLASLASGLGTVPYVVAWLVVPAVGEDRSIASKALTDRRGLTLAAALASLLIVVLLIASAVGASWLGSLASPLVISVAGLVLIWRNAPADEQVVLRHFAEPLAGLAESDMRSRVVWRAAIAGLLLLGGLIALLQGHPSHDQLGRHLSQAAAQSQASNPLLRPLAGVTLIIAAIVVILGPWWLRIARDLVVERQARVRAEERADMAARVHDSVLQTLALIQRHASDPQQVVQFARAQERELRSWLFDGRAPGSLDDEGMTLAAGVRRIQQEVETQHGIAVEAITVGDCELDDDLGALLAAAREATVNAGKWSGAPEVSVFAEVEDAAVSLFVRDRGVGFDPALVPSDRKGLAESVHARMARRGGSATVRSTPGHGTEVTLTMPRAARERQPSERGPS